MNIEKLEKHFADYQRKIKSEKEYFTSNYEERIKRVAIHFESCLENAAHFL